MGEVYRAKDTKLGRDVAIKVLPDAFAADADRLARFTREAQVLASLNHPHIAAIYGIEPASTGSGQANAIVMELVDGEDLSGILARGPMEIGEALRVARQIIDALEAAHDANVIHRDLKPANIKVRADGNVKVLDFGLAKAVDPGGASGADPMNSPTLTARATEMGMVIGTAAYMSPEQAKARPVDRRADIWAFGALLYEMLTGMRAFPGDTASETIANVLKEAPDWSRLPATTPSGVRRLLARTLDKDVRRRLQAIGDARIELEDTAPEPALPARRAVPLAAVSALALVAIAGWALWLNGGAADAMSPVIRLSITPPGRLIMVRQSSSSDANAHWALSADGRQIAFVVQQDATRFLMVRALDRFDARLLPGTEGADLPFWSPDGTAIGFFADGKMKRVSVTGDAVRTICDCAVSGATWGKGMILLGRGGWGSTIDLRHSPALTTVADTGGAEVSLALTGPAGVNAAAWPLFLPDGRPFIYLDLTPNPADRTIMLGSLDQPTVRPIVKSAFKARYATTGHLIYVKDGVLVAQHLDIDRAELSGPITPIVDDMLVAEVPGQAQYETSLAGAVAYQTRGPAVASSMTWIGRDGRPGESVMEPDTFITLDLSRDGRQMAFTTADNSVENEEPPSLVSLFDFARIARSRVRMADVRSAETPLISPDGTRIVFAAHLKAGQLADVREQAVNGTGATDVIASGANYHPIDWSADGRYLLLHEVGTTLAFGRIGMLFVDLQSDRKPVPFLRTTSSSSAQGQFSPDGTFVAYSSDSTGRGEIYLARFPATDERWTVSVDGGTQPRWRRDGRELYFVGGDGAMMAVPTSLGPAVTLGRPVKLFDSGIAPDNYFFYGGAAMYSPSQDGQRFLVIRSLKAGDPGSIRIVINAIR